MTHAPARPAASPDHQTRRLRDLLRADIVRGLYPEGPLPSEANLMSTYHAARPAVRNALGLLRAEGLVERDPGLGTFSVCAERRAQVLEAQGRAGGQGTVAPGARARVLDRSVVATPTTVADRLGPGCGSTCLRLEYVLLGGDAPIAVATNYVRFPEAGALADVDFHADFATFLADAGLAVGDSELLLGSGIVDGPTATLLDANVGSAILTMEQVIWAPDGSAYDWAFVVIRNDRFLLFPRARAGPVPQGSAVGGLADHPSVAFQLGLGASTSASGAPS